MIEYVGLNKTWVHVHLYTLPKRAKTFGLGYAGLYSIQGTSFFVLQSLPVMMTVQYTVTFPFHGSSISELFVGES